MKKLLSLLMIAVSFAALTAATSNKFEDSKDLAVANNQQGLYVFVDSKPVKEYEYLGTVDTRKVYFNSPQYQYVRDYLLKEAKKKFPQADGIILRLSAGDHDKADVIEFK